MGLFPFNHKQIYFLEIVQSILVLVSVVPVKE